MRKAQADDTLYAPSLVDDMVIAINETTAIEISLEAIALQLLPNAERQMYIARVIVHIQQMRPHEMTSERSAYPEYRASGCTEICRHFLLSLKVKGL